MVHIQDFTNATTEPHWGYADRVVPCKNDPGSCAYLDVVYGSHDLGMIYVGVMWLVLAAIFISWALLHHLLPASRGPRRRVLAAVFRRYLLPTAASGPAWAKKPLRLIFGRQNRLQALIVLSMLAYLTVFSFVGMTYATWITPVKAHPGYHNTRTSLGPWANRLGTLAFALTPLSILLGARESLLSVATGVPYQQFTFLHRWVGHVILAQSSLHTIGWCVVEMRLYQPQPLVGREWIRQEYMIWGVVAMGLLLLLWGLATPWGIRMTGYEVFRKAHYVLAMVYVGACWGHWAQLKCFLIPSLALWGIDRALRLLRTAFLHRTGRKGTKGGGGTGWFTSFPTHITTYDDCVRLDVAAKVPVKPGQHYFLTFPDRVWQSHPFTPVSWSSDSMSFIIRARGGETKRLLELGRETKETKVILTGPYGPNTTAGKETNVLCIAGGTGVAYVMPVLLAAAEQLWENQLEEEEAKEDVEERRKNRQRTEEEGKDKRRNVHLVWCMRQRTDVAWVENEMETLRRAGISISVHVTRESLITSLVLHGTKSAADSGPSTPSATRAPSVETALDSSGTDIETPETLDEKAFNLSNDSTTGPSEAADGGLKYEAGRCDVDNVVRSFLDKSPGRTRVYVSGPAGMVADARSAVARAADTKYAGRYGDDVEFFYDERLD